MMRVLAPLILTACATPGTEAPADTVPSGGSVSTVDSATPSGPVPWSKALPPMHEVVAPVRGYTHARAVFHLHSPYSHDACDGRGWVDGQVDEACWADLRDALCTLRFDAAFLTDHPDHASAQGFDELFRAASGDRRIEAPGVVANGVVCADGHEVAWQVGFEDTLMPVGLDRHVAPDPQLRHDLLNADHGAAFAAMQHAGARVLVAHTEGRELETLRQYRTAGLHGLELYNLHAMFAPNIRGDDLGLDPLGWIEDVGPFVTGDDDTLEPDLFFLAVHGEQAVSLSRWDALLAEGQVLGVAGSDAHQNTLPAELEDEERGDSYRRMLRWFSTVLRVEARTALAYDDAIAARRAYVAFEALGTPDGVDLHLEQRAGVVEMGGEGDPGALVVGCPSLAAGSPRGADAPVIEVRVLKDGEPWREGCGRFEADAGVYRVEVWITPQHLRPFLGETPERWIRPYPWVYTNAIRVGG